MITITGVVGSSGKYLVTGIPIDTASNTPLKMTFENKMAGTNLALLAGTSAQFSSGSGGTQLSDSGGPGFMFLTVIDAHKLSGQVIFVRREVGTSDSPFVLTID
jgi:hypothetical protein